MKQKFKIVRNAISDDTIDLLKNTILLTKTVKHYSQNVSQDNLKAFGDEQSPIGFPFYGEIICGFVRFIVTFDATRNRP